MHGGSDDYGHIPVFSSHRKAVLRRRGCVLQLIKFAGMVLQHVIFSKYFLEYRRVLLDY